MLNIPIFPILILAVLATTVGAVEKEQSLFLFPKHTFPGGVLLIRFAIMPEETESTYRLSLNNKEISWELCPQTRVRALCSFAGVEIDGTPPTMKVEVRRTGDLSTVLASGSIPVRKKLFSKRNVKVSAAHGDPSAEDLKRGEEERRRLGAIYDASVKEPLWEKPFRMPGKGGPTSLFGSQRVFNGKLASTHYGVDLRGNEKTWVLSANSGKVVFSDMLFNAGRFVVLDHGGKIFTTYSHLSAFSVKVGDRVDRGQRLGKIGATGRVDGPHLHWGVRINGLYVDPLEFLKVSQAIWK